MKRVRIKVKKSPGRLPIKHTGRTLDRVGNSSPWKSHLPVILVGVLITVLGSLAYWPIQSLQDDQKMIAKTRSIYQDIITEKNPMEISTKLKALLADPDARFDDELKTELYMKLFTQISRTALSSENPESVLDESQQYLEKSEKISLERGLDNRDHLFSKGWLYYIRYSLSGGLEEKYANQAIEYLEQARAFKQSNADDAYRQLSLLNMLFALYTNIGNVDALPGIAAEEETLIARYGKDLRDFGDLILPLMVFDANIAIMRYEQERSESNYLLAIEKVEEVRRFPSPPMQYLTQIKELNVSSYTTTFEKNPDTIEGKQALSDAITECKSWYLLEKGSPIGLSKSSMALFLLYKQTLGYPESKIVLKKQGEEVKALLLDNIKARPLINEILLLGIDYTLAETPSEFEDVHSRAVLFLNNPTYRNSREVKSFLENVIAYSNK